MKEQGADAIQDNIEEVKEEIKKIDTHMKQDVSSKRRQLEEQVKDAEDRQEKAQEAWDKCKLHTTRWAEALNLPEWKERPMGLEQKPQSSRILKELHRLEATIEERQV